MAKNDLLKFKEEYVINTVSGIRKYTRSPLSGHLLTGRSLSGQNLVPVNRTPVNRTNQCLVWITRTGGSPR